MGPSRRQPRAEVVAVDFFVAFRRRCHRIVSFSIGDSGSPQPHETSWYAWSKALSVDLELGTYHVGGFSIQRDGVFAKEGFDGFDEGGKRIDEQAFGGDHPDPVFAAAQKLEFQGTVSFIVTEYGLKA